MGDISRIYFCVHSIISPALFVGFGRETVFLQRPGQTLLSRLNQDGTAFMRCNVGSKVLG